MNDAYHRALTVHDAGFPKTESPYQFRTLELSEPRNKHVKFQNSGVAEIHIKGLPILWFKTDHRINVLEQPKAIRITQRGRALTATLVYEFPNYPPTPVTYQSCGIDPGVVQRPQSSMTKVSTSSSLASTPASTGRRFVASSARYSVVETLH